MSFEMRQPKSGMTIKRNRIIRKLALCGVICLAVTGCAETIIAGLTIADLLTAGSITSSILTGKGLGEHALDAVTGQDCRILDAIFRKERAICEPKDSVATKGDFKGLVALLDTPAGTDIQIADIPMNKEQFPKVNSLALKNSSAMLSVLTRHNVVKVDNISVVADQREMQLIKATQDFSVATANVPEVGTNDLRKRLASGLF